MKALAMLLEAEMALWVEVHWMYHDLLLHEQQQVAAPHLWPSSFAVPLLLSQMLERMSVQTRAAH